MRSGLRPLFITLRCLRVQLTSVLSSVPQPRNCDALPPPFTHISIAQLIVHIHSTSAQRYRRTWSLRPPPPHLGRVDNHGEPLLMSNQELYSVMVQINWTLKTQALTNMQVQWRPKSAGKWHPFQWEAIHHFPTAEGHRAVPSSVSRTGDCMHVWLAGRADLLRLFQRTLFRQADPVSGDAVRFLYTLLSTPPCERQYA